MGTTKGNGSDSAIDSIVQETETDGPVNGLIRRAVVIMELNQLNVGNQNIELFLDALKKRSEKRTPITGRTIQTTPSANIPFKSKSWEWSSTSPFLIYHKYHPDDQKMRTNEHLVALYYRTGPTGHAEVFLVSNNAASLSRFAKNANTDFSPKITKRLVDCGAVLKDSSHHLIGNIFTTTRRLRNKTTIEFNDIPVLLLAFTASLRKHCSLLLVGAFTFLTTGPD